MTADMPAQDLRSLPCSTQGSVQDMIRPGCTGRRTINVRQTGQSSPGGCSGGLKGDYWPGRISMVLLKNGRFSIVQQLLRLPVIPCWSERSIYGYR